MQPGLIQKACHDTSNSQIEEHGTADQSMRVSVDEGCISDAIHVAVIHLASARVLLWRGVK